MDANQSGSSKVAQMIWVIGSPIIFTFGVLGNILTIIVLMKPQNRKTSTALFLSILAWADLMIMLFLLPRWWIIYAFGFDIRLTYNFFCKVHWFITYFLTTFSATMLLFVTVERIISTTKPYKVKVWCNKQSATRVSCIAALFLVCITVHVVYGFSLEVEYVNKTTSPALNSTSNELAVENDASGLTSQLVHEAEVNKKKYVCLWTRDKDYTIFYISVYQWISLTLYQIFPQTVFFLGGIIIIRTLARSRSIRRSYEHHGTLSGNIRSNRKVRNHSTQITITLLSVNAVFFLCTTPVQIFMLGRKYWIDLENGMNELQEILWAIFNQMFYLNHAINFVLYFLSGMKFRSEVLRLFCFRKRNKPTNQAFSSSNITSITENGKMDGQRYVCSMDFTNGSATDVD